MTASRRQSAIAWVASGTVHLLACLIAASIVLSLPKTEALPLLDSAWMPEELSVEAFDLPAAMAEQPAQAPGGQIQEGDELAKEALAASAPAVAIFARPAPVPIEFLQTDLSQGDLLTRIGWPQALRGKGFGTGNGMGDGGGFFGLDPKVAQKIVYVVDNSKSMNYPHESEAKTRFNRVKIEMVNSIWQMEPHQHFYVVFFNDEASPMPATKMQQATPAAKERYLTWVATKHAAGSPTDPRRAVQMALSLQPDIIYFLTDGEFQKGANGLLLKIRQKRTVIHTFAFGGETSEAVLTSIAENNGGKFTVIP